MTSRVIGWARRHRALAFTAAVFLVAAGGTAGWAAVAPAADAVAYPTGRWSPYVVGFGIGLLSCVSFVISNRPIGVSTAYAQTSGIISRAVVGERVERMPYYHSVKPEIGWEWMLALGVLLGAGLSAGLSGDFRVEPVPPLWVSEFGPNAAWRWCVAAVGGFLLGLGSRWAGGCTSGHGISGTLQLVASSWLAVVCFFIGGIATAFALY